MARLSYQRVLTREEQGIIHNNLDNLFKMALTNATVSKIPSVPTELLDTCVKQLTTTSTFDQLDHLIDELKAFRSAGVGLCSVLILRKKKLLNLLASMCFRFFLSTWFVSGLAYGRLG